MEATRNARAVVTALSLAMLLVAVLVAWVVPDAAAAAIPSEAEREAAGERMEALDQQLAEMERNGEGGADVAAIRQQLRHARTTYERLEEAADTAEAAANKLDRAGDRVDDLDRRWDDAVERARHGDLSDLRPSNRTLALIVGALWLLLRLRRLRPRVRPR